MKQAVWGGLIIGSLLGGFIPNLWGADAFSISSLLWSAVGGIAGIYIGLKLAQNF